MSTISRKRYRIAFLHPDLGIGGAERLVVDAGCGLQKLGYHVDFFTSHHSKDHCFDETKDGTLAVKVFGDFLPRNLFGFLHVFFAILRMLYCTLIVLFFYGPYDIFFVDQVSVNIFLLKLFSRHSKVLFYCHHPDKLLVQSNGKGGPLKLLYRIPFDLLEEWSTGLSDKILVNSKYTKEVFRQAFPSLQQKANSLQILYPSINTSKYDQVPMNPSPQSLLLKETMTRSTTIISINRFERKKNIPLALEAFALLIKSLNSNAGNEHTTRKKTTRNGNLSFLDHCILILAGGYDERVEENRMVLSDLKIRAKELNIEDKVTFLPSFSDSDRYFLLNGATILLYTPENEHFGIVPIEAMYCGHCLVVACNSGGPLESIIHEETGLLVSPTPRDFCDAMKTLLALSDEEQKTMLKKAKQNVIKKFSLDSFSQNLDVICQQLVTYTNNDNVNRNSEIDDEKGR